MANPVPSFTFLDGLLSSNFAFNSSDLVFKQQVAPLPRVYNAALAAAGTLTLDYTPPETGSIYRLCYLVSLGDFVLDAIVLAKRDTAGTVTLLSPPNPRALFTALDYLAVFPAYVLTASVVSGAVRVVLTNSTGGALAATLAVAPLSQVL